MRLYFSWGVGWEWVANPHRGRQHESLNTFIPEDARNYLTERMNVKEEKSKKKEQKKRQKSNRMK